MTIRYTEVRKFKWGRAADDIIANLKKEGVQQGQIISIDAHNNGNKEDAIMSAMWDDTIEGRGPLDITYNVQNKVADWEMLYANAVELVSSMKPENLISITGSCNERNRSILFVFYYASPLDSVQHIQYCQARSGESGWNDAAKQLTSELRNQGARSGQVISIDAHSNGPGEDVILHAFWNSFLPAHGDLDIKFFEKLDSGSWVSHYQWASIFIESLSMNVLGVTSSVAGRHGKGITFVFYENDPISNIEFFLDKGNISQTKPLTLATLTNINKSNVEQEMNFEYEESVSDTSTFEHQAGVSITVGTEFSTGVPFIAEGKISAEISTNYAHTWGTSNETNKRGLTGATVKAGPNTKVTCKFSATKSILDVPYVIILKSKKKSSGIWQGVDVWGVTSSYTSEDLMSNKKNP